PRIIGGLGDVELHTIGDAGFLSAAAGGIDRRRMGIEADEFRFGKRLGYKNGRSPEAAAHVGHFGPLLQLRLDAVQSRNPGSNQIGVVVRPEKSLGAFEERFVMISPRQTLAGTKPLGNFGLVLED